MSQPQVGEHRESERGAWLSIGSYVLLTIIKLGAGSWGGSKALVADGINNLTDVVGSVAVLLGLRIARRPADADHRYGHGRAESVAAVVVAAIMGLIGLDVAASAAMAVFRPQLEAPHGAAIWVGLFSALYMFGVYLHNIRLSARTGSKALAAAAYDNRSDALTSVGTVVGILGARAGWTWMDPVAGFVIALIIIRTAWHIGAEAGHSLMDGFDVKELESIRLRVRRVEGVTGVLDARARQLGNVTAIEVTISVDPALNVMEAHAISDRVERALLSQRSVKHVHVHIEPEREIPGATVEKL